jgi:hypothetical protein
MIAEKRELDSDKQASYVALCADVATIVGVVGLPRSSREDGCAVTRAYAATLRAPSIERWRAYHRAVAALVGACGPAASRALDFSAVAACARLHAFLRENPDLADGAIPARTRTRRAAEAGG